METGKTTSLQIDRDITVLPVSIYDGLEPYEYGSLITISANPHFQISFADLSRHPFRNLPEVIGEDGFLSIVREMNLRIPTGPFQTWIGTDDVPLYFHWTKNYAADGHHLIILSWGEFQPGRYIGNLEGIWRVTNLEKNP